MANTKSKAPPAASERIGLAYKPLAEVRRWPRNAKDHDAEGIRESIDRHGFVLPLLVDEGTGQLVAGHGRLDDLEARLAAGRPPPRRIEIAADGGWLVPVLVGIDFGNEAEAEAYLIADNRLVERGGWKAGELVEMLQRVQASTQALSGVGYSADDLRALMQAASGKPQGEAAGPDMRSRFLVPPFSVLDARQGYWKERKSEWLSLGIQSEIGRGENSLGYSDLATGARLSFDQQAAAAKRGELTAPARGTQQKGQGWAGGPARNDAQFYAKKRAWEAEHGRELTTTEFREQHWSVETVASARGGKARAFNPTNTARRGATPPLRGTSIFDPVLCELAVRWYCPPAGSVLDPFAGGSVRGIVTARLGRTYVGVDLRAEQVEANREQWAAIGPGHVAAGDLGGPDLAEEVQLRAPAARVVTDAEELTPVQEVEVEGGVAWLKRDDLFSLNGARGSKARALAALLPGAQGVTTAGNRMSPMVSRVARAAQALGLPCRAHCAGSKELTEEERDAQEHGAELVKHKVNYLTALCSKARKDAEARGWLYVPLGVEGPEYLASTRRQARNVPRTAKRLVVTVGSGMALAAVLHGLDDVGLAIPVLGVLVGKDPMDGIERWAPPGWRDRVELVRSPLAFEDTAEEIRWWGVDLDPHYEAKVAPFVRAGDCFWLVAVRSSLAEGEEPAALEEEVEAAPPAAAPAAPAGPAWAQGFAVEELKAVSEVFGEADKPFALGAFSRVKEAMVAEWAEAGSLVALASDGRVVAAARVDSVGQRRSVRDFADRAIAQLEPGDVLASRVAAREGWWGALASSLGETLAGLPEGRSLFVEVWQESADARALVAALGLVRLGSKVRASSEIVGVYGPPGRRLSQADTEREEATLERLELLGLETAPLLERLRALSPEWADHYSSYNQGHSWSALALRGYGGEAAFIEKPAEMSKRWKAEHAAALSWELKDTPLRAMLPEVEPLLAAIPGIKHRVRLMRLAPGGGELTRHADITDPDAGTAPGKLLRIHVPLVTNQDVVFRQWRLDGSEVAEHMAVGEAWYLDTRKPHTAVNDGGSERIHLVIDVESCPELLALLPPGAPSVAALACAALPSLPGLVEPWRPARGVSSSAPEPLEEAAPPRSAGGGSATWIAGDSLEVLAGHEGSYDLLFSCPPYADLEVYSDDPADISNMPWPDFLRAYRSIIALAAARLRPNRFAVWVVGEVRDPKTGIYRGLIAETDRAFRDAGMLPYNEAILVTAAGSLPLRASKIFTSSRKLGKTHQNVLVFVKGDGRKAADACGPVEVLVGDPGAAASSSSDSGGWAEGAGEAELRED